MCWLIIGIVIFFGVHLIPSFPRLRQRLIQAIGESPYKGAFAVVSFVGLGLMILGMARGSYIAVWNPPSFGGVVAAVLMAPALILLAASNFKGNIKRMARHPMALGILLFALGHLLANGDLAAILLFGSFALFALYNMRPAHSPAAESENHTEESPEKPSIKHDFIAGVIGIAAYILLLVFHARLFGVAVF